MSLELTAPETNKLLTLIQTKFGVDKHPILVMAEIAFNEDEDTKVRLDAAKSIMPYIEASKKSVEVKAQVDSRVGLLRVTVGDKEQTGFVMGERESIAQTLSLGISQGISDEVLEDDSEMDDDVMGDEVSEG